MPVTCPSGRSSTVLTVIHEAYTVTMTCMSPGLAGPSRNLLSDESSSILRRLVDHALDFAAVDVEFAGDGSLAGTGFVPGDLPRAFRTADLWLIHAADCFPRYSSWTCCGVRY